MTAAARLQRRFVRTVLALPPRTLTRITQPPAGADSPLDPHVQAVLALRRRMGYPGLTLDTPESTREFMRQQTALARRVPTPVAEVRPVTVAGAAGPLPGRHYVPERADGVPLLVFFHGGGFVAGDLDTHDEPCRLLCRHAGVHVLSVAYRLAPEHPFPAAVEDAAAAYRWAVAHAAHLGADPTRVAVGGDSAGANLSTVVCQLRVEHPPAAQLLLYPPTRRDDWPSRRAYAEGFLLTGRDMAFFHDLYGTAAYPDDFRHTPLDGPLDGLPPALVVTAAFDPLRDEGEAYAEAMRAAGTTVRAWRVPGQVHGFANLTTLSPAAHAAVVEVARRLADLLSPAALLSSDDAQERS